MAWVTRACVFEEEETTVVMNAPTCNALAMALDWCAKTAKLAEKYISSNQLRELWDSMG